MKTCYESRKPSRSSLRTQNTHIKITHICRVAELAQRNWRMKYLTASAQWPFNGRNGREHSKLLLRTGWMSIILYCETGGKCRRIVWMALHASEEWPRFRNCTFREWMLNTNEPKRWKLASDLNFVYSIFALIYKLFSLLIKQASRLRQVFDKWNVIDTFRQRTPFLFVNSFPSRNQYKCMIVKLFLFRNQILCNMKSFVYIQQSIV